MPQVGRAATELRTRGGCQQHRIDPKLQVKPHDHTQCSHWLFPSDRYVYAHVRTITINTTSLQQTSFSNASKRGFVKIFNNRQPFWFLAETQQQQKGMYDSYSSLEAKLDAITCSSTLSLLVISFNSLLNTKRSSTTTTTTKVSLIL